MKIVSRTYKKDRDGRYYEDATVRGDGTSQDIMREVSRRTEKGPLVIATSEEGFAAATRFMEAMLAKAKR